MAVGGIPTLGDINWAQVAQAKQSKFISEYIRTIADKAYGVAPQLSYDGNNISFTPPAERPLSKTELWNNYKAASDSRGVRPDFDLFEQQIFPRYANLSMESFNNQLVNFASQGVPPKKVQNLYKTSPEFRGLLDLTTSNMSADNPYAMIFQTYKPQPEGPGIVSGIMENPLPIGLGTAGAASIARAAYKKAQDMGGKGKFPRLAKGLRMGGPAAAGMALSPLARFAGATEREAEIAKNIGMTGAGAAYGAQAVKNVARNRLAAGVGAQTKKQLLTSAKKLGIKNVQKTASKQAIQELVENKVKNQSTKATTKALGKSAVQKALAKFGAKAVAKQAIGSGLPVWGNIAAAALTIPDIIQLARALYSGEEEQATPTNEIEVPTNTGY